MDEQDQIQGEATAPIGAPSIDRAPTRRAAGANRTLRVIAGGALALALVLSALAIQRQSASAVSPAAPTTAATAPAATTPPLHTVAAANASEVATIQQVVQRGNDEQVQSIASRDPSAMADTATSDHYQELVRINQDLLDHGVTAIKLVNLEWGPINVNGSQATATTYETWSTSYSDGTTEQSRDRNDYTLLLDNGAWKIQADDHPDDPSSAAPGSAPVPQVPDPILPQRPGSEATSHNWSGYAAVGGRYTSVSGTWTVPQFSPGSTRGIDAAWVGIGGVHSRDLIQAGTQETVSGNGSTQYEAWIEMLPQPSRQVALSVHPGDSISVSISEQSPNTWLFSFTNNTTGETLQRTEHYASTHSSAEWVEEAPSAGRAGILPLDNFGTVQFSSGSTIKDGQQVSIAGAGARAITMINGTGDALAVPSTLADDGASFSVSRTAAPSTRQGVPQRQRVPRFSN